MEPGASGAVGGQALEVLHSMTEGIMPFELSVLGFDPFFEHQLLEERGGVVPARIAAEHRGTYEVWSHAGRGRAQLSGRVRREAEEAGFPGVGDWVVLRQELEADGPAIIDRVLSRRTVFTRGAAGRQARAQVIAANVDVVFAICGLDADFNVPRIERYLARIWASGAQPAVVLNKSDLCHDLEGRRALVERSCPGVPVYSTSALRSEGLQALRETIREGVTVALVGSSGAGKSTLVNALLGEERMRTGGLVARDGRGRHTTVHRQLVLLPGGGLLLDTPGMRELQLLDDEGLDRAFGDVAALGARCRYRDCRHDSEPGCAVQAAVESGALDARRFEHYRKLEREAQAYELRHDVRKHRQAERRWGQLHDEVAQLRKWKGGKP